jgi:hypothetical protein
MLVEAGIREIYIDSGAFRTTLGINMLRYFEGMSLPVFTGGGLRVFRVTRGADQLETLNKPGHAPPPDATFNIQRLDDVAPGALTPEFFRALINEEGGNHRGHPFAAGIGEKDGKAWILTAQTRPSPGLNPAQIAHWPRTFPKYSAEIQALSRVFALAARHGITLKPYVFSLETPSARVWVDLVGRGAESIYITSPADGPEAGHIAMKQLTENGIIQVLAHR